jgi:hypothetical protein
LKENELLETMYFLSDVIAAMRLINAQEIRDKVVVSIILLSDMRDCLLESAETPATRD